jgi:hypothetical protein
LVPEKLILYAKTIYKQTTTDLIAEIDEEPRKAIALAMADAIYRSEKRPVSDLKKCTTPANLNVD